MDTAVEDGFGIIDGRTITFERTNRADIQIAWRAISTKEALDNWFIHTTSELTEGSRFTFKDSWAGTVGEVTPQKTIQFTADEGGVTRFTLRDAGAGTVHFTLSDRMGAGVVAKGPTTDVGLRQPGGAGTHWSGAAAGWHGFADAMVAYVEGRAAAFDYAGMTERYDAFLAEWWATHARPSD
jgi:uncharacterized protein YndB with AHSA1/START domain